MTMPTKILLQTTIEFDENDWHINRFSLLREHLESQKDELGNHLFEVTGRNVEKDVNGNDSLLPNLSESDFDEVWLIAVDGGDGLSEADRAGVSRFQQRGGGLLLTRDHMDLGSCICDIGNVGSAHIFHSKQQDADESRRLVDDNVTTSILFPNYHSGANGDLQMIKPTENLPAAFKSLVHKSGDGEIAKFPAHPHEGDVCLPKNSATAQIIATGRSQLTRRNFNLIVAIDRETDKNGQLLGRAIAESSFHHFADYNWNPEKGCPTFVTETPGDAVLKDPAALDDIKSYARNAALWLASKNQKVEAEQR